MTFACLFRRFCRSCFEFVSVFVFRVSDLANTFQREFSLLPLSLTGSLWPFDFGPKRMLAIGSGAGVFEHDFEVWLDLTPNLFPVDGDLNRLAKVGDVRRQPDDCSLGGG